MVGWETFWIDKRLVPLLGFRETLSDRELKVYEKNGLILDI